MACLSSYYPIFSSFANSKSTFQDSIYYPPKLNIQHSLTSYKLEVKIDPTQKLENLKAIIPCLKIDIRYASTNNFMHQKAYSSAVAFLRIPAALALKKVQDALMKRGLGLVIYDAYRPYSVTLKIFDLVKNSKYAASGATGSIHNRGCAVDLSLIDLKTGQELPMPTAFDSFSEAADSRYMNLSALQILNRSILTKYMNQFGFTQLKTEWWHFDFKDWQRFRLIDIPFEQL